MKNLGMLIVGFWLVSSHYFYLQTNWTAGNTIKIASNLIVIIVASYFSLYGGAKLLKLELFLNKLR